MPESLLDYKVFDFKKEYIEPLRDWLELHYPLIKFYTERSYAREVLKHPIGIIYLSDALPFSIDRGKPVELNINLDLYFHTDVFKNNFTECDCQDIAVSIGSELLTGELPGANYSFKGVMCEYDGTLYKVSTQYTIIV